jgi:hypothetical protein
MSLSRPNIVHRRDRRKLGRDQSPTTSGVTVVVTSTGTTNATLTYSRGVVKKGNPALSVATRTIVSSALTSPNVVSVVLSGNATGMAYTVAAADPNVSPTNGGNTAGAAGTFP